MVKPDINMFEKRQGFILSGLLLFHLLLLFNLRFTAWPEMLTWPYLMLKGWLPYRDIAIAHNPLLLVDLTIFNYIFGTGVWQLKIYTWLTILSIDLLLYWIVKKFWNAKNAFYSLIFFIPLQLFYEGNGLWFDLSLTFAALLSYYYASKKSYFKAGVFWALAFLVKQTAFWFLLPIMINTFQGQSLQGGITKLKKFATGGLLVLVPFILIIWISGILPDYLFWAYKFGVGTLPRASGQVNFPELTQAIKALTPFLILLFFVLVYKGKGKISLMVFTIAGFMGTIPRWELFHFQPALPFLAISGGLIVSKLRKNKNAMFSLLVLYFLTDIVLIGRFMAREWAKGDRFFEPDVTKAANFIRENLNTDDEIYVLNYWDSLYALSDTLPATKPVVPYLPWYLEYGNLKGEVIRDLKTDMPEIIVKGKYSKKELGSYRIFEIDELIERYYHLTKQLNSVEIYALNK